MLTRLQPLLRNRNCDRIELEHMSTITIPKTFKIGEEPVVVFPLKKWKKIEEDLENLEMHYYSKHLASEIAKRRKTKELVSLEKLLKKYRI